MDIQYMDLLVFLDALPYIVKSMSAERSAKSGIPIPFSTGFGYVLRHTHKAVSRRLASELAEIGIAFKHYYYLRALFETDGISQVELSEQVGVDQSTVVTVIDTLVRQKLVERRKDPTDRRKALIYLTAKGRALRHPIRAAIDAVHGDALHGISAADLKTFRSVAARVRRNLAYNDG
jgi:DNA-binding MarR family transcriptional regulator